MVQQSKKDPSIFPIHFVQASWAKRLKTSVVAFDIAQFFPYSILQFLNILALQII